MKKHYIDIHGKWAIVLAYDIWPLDTYEITDWLERLGATDTEIHQACTTILNYNTGFSFTDSHQRMSLVCISKVTSIDEWVNTLAHEIDHVQEEYCDYYGIGLGTEKAAYVQGDIAGAIIKEIGVNK